MEERGVSLAARSSGSTSRSSPSTPTTDADRTLRTRPSRRATRRARQRAACNMPTLSGQPRNGRHGHVVATVNRRPPVRQQRQGSVGSAGDEPVRRAAPLTWREYHSAACVGRGRRCDRRCRRTGSSPWGRDAEARATACSQPLDRQREDPRLGPSGSVRASTVRRIMCAATAGNGTPPPRRRGSHHSARSAPRPSTGSRNRRPAQCRSSAGRRRRQHENLHVRVGGADEARRGCRRTPASPTRSARRRVGARRAGDGSWRCAAVVITSMSPAPSAARRGRGG